MARIERTLKAAGFDWTDLVDGVVYITDIANFQAMNNGYRPVIAQGLPRPRDGQDRSRRRRRPRRDHVRRVEVTSCARVWPDAGPQP